jgi:hypothetical protein
VPPDSGAVRGQRIELDPLVCPAEEARRRRGKEQGGDRKSGRIEAEAGFLLDEVAETPDITLVELQEN